MWSGDDMNAKEIPIVHASELASLDRKCSPALGLDPDNVAIKLRYPGSKFPEQYVYLTIEEFFYDAQDNNSSS